MTSPGGPEQPDQPEAQQPPTHESGWPPPPGYSPPGQQAEPTQPYPQDQPPYGGQPQSPYDQPYQQPYGQPQPPYQQPYAQAAYNAYRAPDDPGAQTSMIIGIVSLALGLMCGVGFLGSPFAWVMGARSKRRIDASNGQLGGRGSAQAGLVLGIVGTVLLILGIIAIVAMIGLFVAGIASDPAFDTYEYDGTAA